MTTPTLAGGRQGPWAVAALRVAASLFLLQHGLQKTLGLFADPTRPRMPFNPMSQFGVAGILESTLPVLVLLGLFTRPAAFVLSGEMAFAYFLAHAPRGFVPIQNGGELAALFTFVFLAIAALGPGAASLDGLRARARR